MNPDGGTGPGWAGFIGAKAALFCGPRVLTLHRDNLPGLPWANHWDLPGGGREGDETPEACLLRELAEEFGLHLPPARLTRRWILPSMTDPARPRPSSPAPSPKPRSPPSASAAKARAGR